MGRLGSGRGPLLDPRVRYLCITPMVAGGPLLDGSPVTLLVERDGSMELETDMLVFVT